MPDKKLNNKIHTLILKGTAKNLVVVSCCLFLFLSLLYLNQAANAHFAKAEKEDICPVCGMSLTEHPMWVAVIMFKDGKHVKFHGPKNMLIYYFNIGKYTKKYRVKDIAGLYVTEYYSLKHIKAQKAYYAVGSDVKGPMGDELIPLKDIESYEKFLKEHGGKIMTFDEITSEIINNMPNIPVDNPTGDH